MNNGVYVLDASAIIGGFISKRDNFVTASVVNEIKDLKSKISLETAIEEGSIKIIEPDDFDLEEVCKVIKESGDILRLSGVDINLVALGYKLQRESLNPTVVTDDYSMQNVLKIIGIPYRSVLTKGINEIYGWIKVCKGCKTKYPSEYESDECEICGTRIIKKRIKNP
ncbi:MAG: ribonuclease VapC [Methanobacterium sp.]|nr:ribonuclease VapC [Methanobacterium sp.]